MINKIDNIFIIKNKLKRKTLLLMAIMSIMTISNFSYVNASEITVRDINNTVNADEKKQIEENKKTNETVNESSKPKVEDLEAKDEGEKAVQNKKVDVFQGVENSDIIVRLSSQSKEELQGLYDRGFRVFEICISSTVDNQLVLADNFNEYFEKYYGKSIPRPTIDAYFSHKMKNGNTQMSMGDINVFLNNNPDARFFVRTLDTQKNVFDILNSKSFKNKDKLIIEINDILAKYKSIDNVAMVDLRGKNNIYSYAVNNKENNIMFLYQNTQPTFEELEVIKESGTRLYDNNKPILDSDYENYFTGKIYSIEEALNMSIKSPKQVKSNSYVNPIIKNDRFIAHAGGKIAGIVGTNTLQAMNSSYDRGNRIIEIDFDWTSDGKIVQVHDWPSFNKLSGALGERYYMSFEEFKNRKMIYQLKQMSMYDTIEWMKTNQDAYIVTDVKESHMINGNIKALSVFAKDGKEVQSRIIPQIYDTMQYQEVKNLGYKNIIYTLYRTEQSPYNVLEFAKSNDLFAVAMDNIYRVHTKLPELLTNNGIRVYIHTENNIMNAKAYIGNQKAYGIYSDDILSLSELDNIIF